MPQTLISIRKSSGEKEEENEKNLRKKRTAQNKNYKALIQNYQLIFNLINLDELNEDFLRMLQE